MPKPKPRPGSVIHINFLPGNLLFDARPIWAALQSAEKDGKIPVRSAHRLSQKFGETALHLGTRHCVIKMAVQELVNALKEIYDQVPNAWNIPETNGMRVINGASYERQQ
jgi:hypothetical protein